MNLLNHLLPSFIMDITEFDSDKVLTGFLTDYIDGNLNDAERQSFEEYLANNEREGTFARKALMGKRALSRLANRFNKNFSNTESLSSSITATDIG